MEQEDESQIILDFDRASQSEIARQLQVVKKSAFTQKVARAFGQEQRQLVRPSVKTYGGLFVLRGVSDKVYQKVFTLNQGSIQPVHNFKGQPEGIFQVPTHAGIMRMDYEMIDQLPQTFKKVIQKIEEHAENKAKELRKVIMKKRGIFKEDQFFDQHKWLENTELPKYSQVLIRQTFLEKLKYKIKDDMPSKFVEEPFLNQFQFSLKTIQDIKITIGSQKRHIQNMEQIILQRIRYPERLFNIEMNDLVYSESDSKIGLIIKLAVRYAQTNIEVMQLNVFGFQGEMVQINHCSSFFSIIEEQTQLKTLTGVQKLKQIAQAHEVNLPKFTSVYLLQNTEDRCFLEIQYSKVFYETNPNDGKEISRKATKQIFTAIDFETNNFTNTMMAKQTKDSSNILAVVLNSSHVIYTRVLFIKTDESMLAMSLDLFSLLSPKDQVPQDSQGRATLQVDDISWTPDDLFLVLVMKNSQVKQPCCIGILPRLGNTFVQVINPQISQIEQQSFAWCCSQREPKVAKNEKFSVQDLQWSNQVEAHARLIYKVRVTNLVQTFEKKIDLSYVKPFESFDLLRQSLTKRDEASSVELLMKLPEILTPLIPLGKLEQMYNQFEKELRLAEEMNFKLLSAVDQEDSVVVEKNNNRESIQKSIITNSFVPNMEANESRTPQKILSNLQKLLTAARWADRHGNGQASQVDATGHENSPLNLKQWLLTIVQDCFFHLLQFGHPVLAYTALKITENFFCDGNESADFYLNREIEGENHLLEIHQIILNQKSTYDQIIQSMRDAQAELSSQQSNSSGKRTDVNLIQDILPLAYPVDLNLHSKSLDRFKHFTEGMDLRDQSLFLYENYMNPQKTLSSRFQSVAIKNKFTLQYLLLILFCMIQFRNYQSANFNILSLVQANFISQRQTDPQFILGVKKILETLRHNYLFRGKTSETEMFLGSMAVNAKKCAQVLSEDKVEMVDTLTKFNHIKDAHPKNFQSIQGKNDKAQQFLDVIDIMDLGNEDKLKNIFEKYYESRQTDQNALIAFKLGFKSNIQPDYSELIQLIENDDFKTLSLKLEETPAEFADVDYIHSVIMAQGELSDLQDLFYKVPLSNDPIQALKLKVYGLKEAPTHMRTHSTGEGGVNHFSQSERQQMAERALNLFMNTTHQFKALEKENIFEKIKDQLSFRRFLMLQRYNFLNKFLVDEYKKLIKELVNRQVLDSNEDNSNLQQEVQLRAIETVNLFQTFLQMDPNRTKPLDTTIQLMREECSKLFDIEDDNLEPDQKKFRDYMTGAVHDVLDKFVESKPTLRNGLPALQNLVTNHVFFRLIDFFKTYKESETKYFQLEEFFKLTEEQEANFMRSIAVGNHDNGLGGTILEGDFNIDEMHYYSNVDECRKVWLTSSEELIGKLKHEGIYYNMIDFLQVYRTKFHSNNDSMKKNSDDLFESFMQLVEIQQRLKNEELGEFYDKVPIQFRLNLFYRLSRQIYAQIQKIIKFAQLKDQQFWEKAFSPLNTEVKLFGTAPRMGFYESMKAEKAAKEAQKQLAEYKEIDLLGRQFLHKLFMKSQNKKLDSLVEEFVKLYKKVEVLNSCVTKTAEEIQAKEIAYNLEAQTKNEQIQKFQFLNGLKDDHSMPESTHYAQFDISMQVNSMLHMQSCFKHMAMFQELKDTLDYLDENQRLKTEYYTSRTQENLEKLLLNEKGGFKFAQKVSNRKTSALVCDVWSDRDYVRHDNFTMQCREQIKDLCQFVDETNDNSKAVLQLLDPIVQINKIFALVEPSIQIFKEIKLKIDGNKDNEKLFKDSSKNLQEILKQSLIQCSRYQDQFGDQLMDLIQRQYFQIGKLSDDMDCSTVLEVLKWIQDPQNKWIKMLWQEASEHYQPQIEALDELEPWQEEQNPIDFKGVLIYAIKYKTYLDFESIKDFCGSSNEPYEQDFIESQIICYQHGYTSPVLKEYGLVATKPFKSPSKLIMALQFFDQATRTYIDPKKSKSKKKNPEKRAKYEKQERLKEHAIAKSFQVWQSVNHIHDKEREVQEALSITSTGRYLDNFQKMFRHQDKLIKSNQMPQISSDTSSSLDVTNQVEVEQQPNRLDDSKAPAMKNLSRVEKSVMEPMIPIDVAPYETRGYEEKKVILINLTKDKVAKIKPAQTTERKPFELFVIKA